MTTSIQNNAMPRRFAAVILVAVFATATFQANAQPIVLSIDRPFANAVTISWPTNGATSSILEFSSNLLNWQPDATPVTVVNGSYAATESISAGNKVFRVRCLSGCGSAYSINVVGYFNLQVPANRTVLFANPLDTTNNSIAAVLADVPANTILYRYCGGCSPANSGSWKAASYSADDDDDQILSWGQAGSETLPLGEGAIIRNTTASPFFIAFIGEVPQGTRTNLLAAGYSLKASVFPQGASLPLLAFPAEDGDIVTQLSGTSFLQFFYDGFGGIWDPSDPVVNAGEAFWLLTPSSKPWIRTFTVN